MKKDNTNYFAFIKSFGLFFLVILSISNCKEKIEGCLDIEAENFAFSVDKPCPDDCCTYPSLTFEIAFRWDTVPLIYGDPYNLMDKVIKITKSKFYISDISLTNDTDTLIVTDRIELIVNDGSQGNATFVDDFDLLSRGFASFSYEIGEIRGSATFDTLHFIVGLSDFANKVEPALAPEGHPLSIQSDSMWSIENAYVFNKLIVIPDTVPPLDTIPIEFNITDVAGNLNNKVEITLPFKINLEVGTDLVVPLKVDYFQWFQGIDFEINNSQDSIEILTIIVESTTQAFSINE